MLPSSCEASLEVCDGRTLLRMNSCHDAKNSPRICASRGRPSSTHSPEAPAILFLRSDLMFRSDLKNKIALACKRENKIGSKNEIGS